MEHGSTPLLSVTASRGPPAAHLPASLHVLQDAPDQPGLLDAGDGPQFATAFRARLDGNGEHPFQAVHPTQRRAWLVGVHPMLPAACYIFLF